MHAEIQSGIETVLQIIDFDGLLDGCELVITGEGQIDFQSLDGKLISGILRHTVRKQIPTIAIVGSVAEELEQEPYEAGLTAIFSINRRAESFSVSSTKSHRNYQKTLEDILRLWTQR